MQEETVTTLAEFRSYISSFSDMCFRGHSDNRWMLVPTIFRNLVGLTPPLDEMEMDEVEELERDVWREFNDLSWAHRENMRNVNWSDPWQVLCLAQHYGVPTRLLDWTFNANVALFFAVASLSAADGAVYGLDMTKLPALEYSIGGRRLPRKGYRLELFRNLSLPVFWGPISKPVPSNPDNTLAPEPQVTVERPKEKSIFTIIEPPKIDRRIEAQDGVFSIFIPRDYDDRYALTSWDHLAIIRIIEDETNATILHKINIPSSCKRELDIELRRQSVTHAKLFPDMSGLGLHFEKERNLNFLYRIGDYR